MAKKTETVETAGEEPKAPTKSLFAGGVPNAAETTETVEATEEASEATEEAVAEDDGVSIDELRQAAEEANKKLLEKLNAEKSGILAQVVQVVGEYGITTEEVVAALGGLKLKRKGVPAKAKYRDPATGAEWSGRGKEPLWIRDKDRAQFLIETPAA